MPGSLRNKAVKAIGIAIALLPWLVSMYAFYWLDSSGTWTTETPHRGKLSVVILAIGMGSSLLLYSFIERRWPK